MTDWAAVTPARNEAENLRRLGASMARQTVLPLAWIIVDDNSDDDTDVVAAALELSLPWTRHVRLPGNTTTLPGAPIVRAFNAGLELVPVGADVLVKLDADVSFAEDHFEKLLAAFEHEPKLGIASGVAWELVGSEWRPTFVTGAHVRGAVRAYRRACFEAIGGIQPRMGWDTLDELQANALGWTTRILPDIAFQHHRKVGARDGGRRRRWSALGESSYYMRYRPSYMLLRTLHQVRREPAAAAMLATYLAAMIRRRPRHPADDAIRLLRDRQRLRNLPARAREALGRNLKH